MNKKIKVALSILTLSLICSCLMIVIVASGSVTPLIGHWTINRHADARRADEAAQLEHELEMKREEELAGAKTARARSSIVVQVALMGLGLVVVGGVVVGVWRLALGRVRSVRESAAIGYAWASKENVPQAITYSPAPRVHYSVKSDNALPDQLPVLPPLPDFTDLMTLALPAPSIALLGLGPGGEAITNKWEKAKHICIVGPTGGGKSVLSKTLIVQSLRSGHDVHILDPHFTRFDAETGEDWTPVTSRLKAQPATRIADITSRLVWAVGQMERRLELREQGEKYLPHIIRLVLDEVPAIVEQNDEAANLISRVLREGRKVGVLLQLATQDMLAKTLGFKSGAAVRKNFSTAFVMRDCDPTSARLFIKAKEFSADALDVGVACIVTEGQRGHVIARIPYTSNEAVERILNSTAPAPLLTQSPQIPAISPVSPPVAPQITPVSPQFTAENSGSSGQTAGESSDSGQSSAIAVGGGSAKAICFSIWDVNEGASYESVMEIAGIKKRNTARSYKAQWKKKGLS